MSDDYQRQVIDFYARRHDYDNDFTEARALKLVNYLYLQKKQSMLDVATGTGFIAIATRDRNCPKSKKCHRDLFHASNDCQGQRKARSIKYREY